MIIADREALKEIHAEIKKGLRKATTTATANQEAFRKFVVEQSKAFRKKKMGWHPGRHGVRHDQLGAMSKSQQRTQVPKGSGPKGPSRRPHPLRRTNQSTRRQSCKDAGW